ncbi:unnamed protein product [Mytilus coruscus]|uniref:Uncharacterized protein n=1 Tax=Mytilus coruscus TaxID=42192 RepID=A0A6J8CS87_MYTCO|nr:unnamed protein product [Mytilus coruscus]
MPAFSKQASQSIQLQTSLVLMCSTFTSNAGHLWSFKRLVEKVHNSLHILLATKRAEKPVFGLNICTKCNKYSVNTQHNSSIKVTPYGEVFGQKENDGVLKGTLTTDEFINEEAIEGFISDDIPTNSVLHEENDSQTDSGAQTIINSKPDNETQSDNEAQTDNESSNDIDSQTDIDSHTDNDSQTDNESQRDSDSQTDNDSQIAAAPTDHNIDSQVQEGVHSVAKRRQIDFETDIDCIILTDLLTDETDTLSGQLSLTDVDSKHD